LEKVEQNRLRGWLLLLAPPLEKVEKVDKVEKDEQKSSSQFNIESMRNLAPPFPKVDKYNLNIKFRNI